MLKLMKIWNRDLDLNIQKSFSWIYLNTRSVTRYLCCLNLFGIHSWKSIWPWRPVSDRCRWRNWAHWPFIYEKRFQTSSNESNKIHFYNCLVLVFIKLSFLSLFSNQIVSQKWYPDENVMFWNFFMVWPKWIF